MEDEGVKRQVFIGGKHVWVDEGPSRAGNRMGTRRVNDAGYYGPPKKRRLRRRRTVASVNELHGSHPPDTV